MNHSQILAAAFEIKNNYNLEGKLELIIQASFSVLQSGSTEMTLVLHDEDAETAKDTFEKFKASEQHDFFGLVKAIKSGKSKRRIIVNASNAQYLFHLFNVECAMLMGTNVQPTPEFQT